MRHKIDLSELQLRSLSMSLEEGEGSFARMFDDIVLQYRSCI